MNPKIFFLCFRSFVKDHFIGTTKALRPYFIDYALNYMGKKSECKILKIPTPFWEGSYQTLAFQRKKKKKIYSTLLFKEGVPLK